MQPALSETAAAQLLLWCVCCSAAQTYACYRMPTHSHGRWAYERDRCKARGAKAGSFVESERAHRTYGRRGGFSRGFVVRDCLLSLLALVLLGVDVYCSGL